MKFYLESLGCAKNQVESENIITGLSAHGLVYTSKTAEADVILVNTCGFISSAREESINVGLEFKSLYPTKKVIMLGCLAIRYSDELKTSLTELDGVISAVVVEDIVSQVFKYLKINPRPSRHKQDWNILRRPFFSFPGSMYVRVADGCDNNCTYCAIPLIRGRLRSRPLGSIMAEIEQHVQKGIIEFNLIAQDLSSFGNDTGQGLLVDLLKEILNIRAAFWIRLLYIHPDHFPSGLLDLMQSDERILPYFDIPFQHASAEVLSRMGRRGNSAVYLDLISRIRERIPQAVIRTTLLTGFPGESEDDYKLLLDFQQQARLDWVGIFTYSKEEGTKAHTLGGVVPEGVARKRRKKLELEQVPITEKNLGRFVGQQLPVLIEERVQGEELYLGRAYLHAPAVDGLVVVSAAKLKPGKIYPVNLVKQNGFDLEGVPLY